MTQPRHLALILALSLAAAAALSAARGLQAQPADYVVHEWGTFTTVSGSDGGRLAGLEREEEALPAFVRAHDGICPPEGCGKGLARPLANVTVKLETPVLYFYSPEAMRATVSVGFRGGSISQWYPERAGGETPPELRFDQTGLVADGAIDFARGYDGAIRWDVDVLAPGDYSPAAVLDGDETPTWIYPRLTDSNVVDAGGDRAEKYLFYRGLGRFDLPVAFSMPDDGTLRIQNRGTERLPFLLVYHNPDESGADQPGFLTVDGLDGGAAADVSLRELERPPQWRIALFDRLVEALEAAGLYRKEADAMVQTWWRSYFRAPGLRVFWIVPRAFTDQVLPIRLDPVPEALVRVMVGRSEVLTPAFENQLRREYREVEDPGQFRAWDRFGLAHTERVKALESGTDR
jgi:hypothetical protein